MRVDACPHPHPDRNAICETHGWSNGGSVDGSECSSISHAYRCAYGVSHCCSFGISHCCSFGISH